MSLPHNNASNTKAASSNLQAAGPPSTGAKVWPVMSFSLSVFQGFDEGGLSSLDMMAFTGGGMITVVVNSMFSVVRGMMDLENGIMILQCRLVTEMLQ
jgi:hypothetical protein